MAIPYVTHDEETIRIYADPVTILDPEQARELLTMIVGSIARIEGGTGRLALLFDALLDRYSTGDTAETS